MKKSKFNKMVQILWKTLVLVIILMTILFSVSPLFG